MTSSAKVDRMALNAQGGVLAKVGRALECITPVGPPGRTGSDNGSNDETDNGSNDSGPRPQSLYKEESLPTPARAAGGAGVTLNPGP